MNFYLYHHKSTEVLATESKTNDHSPCHMSNMDCSQVAGANIWLLATFISNQGCSFFLKSTCSHRILSGFYTDFLKVIERQFDTQFKNLLVKILHVYCNSSHGTIFLCHISLKMGKQNHT